MKYVEPVDGEEDDPYVDENPATGTNGSAVPAAAIEHPMREIVNVITEAGGTPDEEDLTQLHTAISAMIAAAIAAIPADDDAVGEWEPIATYDLAGESDVLVDDTVITSTYADFKFVYRGVYVSTAGAIIQVNASIDNGSNFIGGRQTGHATNSNTASLSAINHNNSNGAGSYAPRLNNTGLQPGLAQPFSGEYILRNPHSTALEKQFDGNSNFTGDGTQQINHEYMTALFQESSAVDAFKTSLTTGTWTAGTLEIYGRKAIVE